MGMRVARCGASLPHTDDTLEQKQIAELAIKSQLPLITGWAEIRRRGQSHSVSYEPNRRDAVRHLAYFVDRIVRGTKPADLPVERPTRFELVINIPTANAPRALEPHVKQAAAWLLVIAGFVSAVVAFFIDAERPATNPWLLFVAGVGLAVVGIILIAFDRRAR